jgi:peptidoglycan/LPS O-acetylase OafA/YrhL
MNFQRLPELDLLRFLAALSVVFFHYGFRGYAADDMTVMAYPWIAPAAKYGFLGVNLFFMISGFVIWMSAADGCAKRFVISRVVRLYPAFWACCTATFLVILIAADARFSASFPQYAVNMTMLSEFVGVDPIDGVYWSLFVEMKFYALVVAVLIFKLIPRAKELLGLWLVLALYMSTWSVHYLDYFLVPVFAPYFIAGAMFCLIRSEGACAYKLFIVAASYLAAVKNALFDLLDKQAHYVLPFSASLIAAVLAVFFAAFLWLAMQRRPWLSGGKWLALGALTYPLYLIHQNIGFIIFNRLSPHANPHLVMAGTIAAMLGAAYLVNRYVERRYAKSLRAVLEKFFRVRPRALPAA